MDSGSSRIEWVGGVEDGRRSGDGMSVGKERCCGMFCCAGTKRPTNRRQQRLDQGLFGNCPANSF